MTIFNNLFLGNKTDDQLQISGINIQYINDLKVKIKELSYKNDKQSQESP